MPSATMIGPEPDPNEDHRREARCPSLKSVKLLIGGDMDVSVINARVIDSSAFGVRVRTALPAAVPEWITLKYSDGTSHRAQRRWQRGNEIGLRLVPDDGHDLLDALIAGLSHDQRRALIARIEASMVSD